MTTPGKTSPGLAPIEAIVVGGSAGGIEALGILLGGLPDTFGAALIVVVHMPPNNDSLLAEVLRARCALPLQEAFDKMDIEPGHVYVAPAGYHLLVEPGRTFALSIDEPVNFARPSIDVLFESAAYAYRSKLLGIILTGANEDGAQGLATIRASGGHAWVQRPETAVASVMPASAIEVAGADRVLDLAQMAKDLACVGVGQ